MMFNDLIFSQIAKLSVLDIIQQSLRTTLLDLIGSILLEFMEVLFEHLGNFLKVLVIFTAIIPAFSGVEDLGANLWKCCWVL